MSFRSLLILSLLLFCSSSYAADINGRFSIKGQGLASCEQFVKARNAQSREYFQFGGWINGYLSATNRYEKQTFDVIPWQSISVLSGWLAQFCKANPELQFVRAVVVMVNLLGKERLIVYSKRVISKSGAVSISLYEATLRRMQELLVKGGYYEGIISGRFDKKTSLALQSFQRKMGLKATGLPDQITLAKLF